MKFRDYFNNDFETSEDHYLRSLRTRYYRCRNDDAMEKVKQVALKRKARIESVDEERHEIIFETRNYSVTATLVSPMMSETAIDLKVNTYKMLPFGKGKKIIEELYKELDSVLPFKDISLYRGR